MAANQNPNQQSVGGQQNPNPQQQAQNPQQMPNGYNYPPPGYYPPQYNYPPCTPQPQQSQREEGIGLWTALGLFGAGFLVGQLFSEPTPQQATPPPQGVKLPWQK